MINRMVGVPVTGTWGWCNFAGCPIRSLQDVPYIQDRMEIVFVEPFLRKQHVSGNSIDLTAWLGESWTTRSR